MAHFPKVLLRALPVWLSAAWAMGLTYLGFFVVPMLFAHMPSPPLAGAMAGNLFGVQTWISVILALALLLLVRKSSDGQEGNTAGGYSALVLAGAVMALLVEFGATPHILAHDNLPMWHGIASALYLGQWICALLAFAHNARHMNQPRP